MDTLSRLDSPLLAACREWHPNTAAAAGLVNAASAGAQAPDVLRRARRRPGYLVWRSRPGVFGVLDADPVAREALAAAWYRAGEPTVRLAVPGGRGRTENAAAVAGHLRRADAVGSAFVLDPTLSAGSIGTGVLRVGALPGRAGGRLESLRGGRTDVNTVLVGVTGDECDLLVLDGPGDLAAAAGTAFVSARCLVVLNVDDAGLCGLPEAARRLDASGWILSTGRRTAVAWIGRLVQRLARPGPLDVAVAETDPTAVVVAHPELVEDRRPVREPSVPSARSAPRRWPDRLYHAHREWDGGAWPAAADGDGRADRRAYGVVAGRADRVDDGPEPVGPEATPPPGRSGERFLQAQVTIAATGAVRRRAFKPGTVHHLTVFVGPGMVDFIRAEQRFDESAVVFTQAADVVPLDVFLRLWIDDGRPVSADPKRIFLPRTGRSTSDPFLVEVPASATEVRCEISLYAGQRMVQILSVAGAVAKADRAPQDRQLRAVRTLHLGSPDLVEQPSKAASVRVDAGTGDATVVDATGGRVIRLPHADVVLEQITTPLRDALAADELDGGSPNSPQQVDLLRRLARRGHGLFQKLVDAGAGDLGANEYLQVVSDDADEVLPLEFTYDYGSPSDTATLCTQWQHVRPGRHCTCRPRGRGRQSRRTICPVGFWGIRMVIERHIAARAGLGPDDLMVTSRPATGRRRLARVDSALLAASHNVDRVNPTERSDTDAAFTAWLGERYHPVDNWSEWRAVVRGHSPALLVSLSHTESRQDDLTLLIGARSRLRVDLVGPHHICGPRTENGPVVLLIGCNTAAAQVPWQSVAAAFRRARAPVVVGTLIETLGRQAAPMARELVACLSSADGDLTVGHLIRAMRRRLLMRGFTMAMALVAVGDADWVLPVRSRR